jgi:NADPH:quinone reductase-like Zn-dependent oxidoreductase
VLPARVSSVTFGVSMRAASRLAAEPATGPARVLRYGQPHMRIGFSAVRAVVIAKHGGPEVLEVQERPDPSPGPGQVRIDVRAAGVNFADTLARVGLYADAPKPPCVVGYEVAGAIGAVGDGVDAGRVGERVMAGTPFGGYAERVVVPAADVEALPERLSFEEGAAVPVVYATAWASLYGYGSLRAGERVLVHSAAGGVGIAAVQLAKRGGAEVHGTASPAKHDRLRELGLDRAIDYRADGWWRDLPAYDLIIDGIGGASFKRSNALLRPGGRLVALGASSVQEGEKRNLRRALPQALRMMRGFDLIKQMSESKAFIGINMKRLWDDRGTLAPWSEPLSAYLDDGTIAPVVHAAVPFARAGEAHRILAARENVGKVVLVP